MAARDAVAQAAYRHAVIKAAGRFGVEADAVLSAPGTRTGRRSPGRAAAQQARRVALYLTVVVHDHTMKGVGRVAGLSNIGVRKALRHIEDWRDDPEADRTLEELTMELVA